MSGAGVEKESGLESRYHVKRLGDPSGKHDTCRYFVLDPQHDPTAREVLAEYARRTPNHDLRRDLRDWLDALTVWGETND